MISKSKKLYEKVEKRISSKLSFRIIGNSGSVAQLLHPVCLDTRDIRFTSDALNIIDKELSTFFNLKIVLTGGGFISIDFNDFLSNESWRSKKTLLNLENLVRESFIPIRKALKGSVRDYIVGADVFDKNDKGGGQFAVAIRNGNIEEVVWKSYPVSQRDIQEQNWLAGFGTLKGRKSPRIVPTSLGNAMVLICHDAQAFNHRNIALVRRAQSPTPRTHVIREMHRQMISSRPEWIFNLVHQIEREENLRTFCNSYKQIFEDYGHHPRVVGSFGYGRQVRRPELLADLAQFPENKSGVKIILEAN